MTTPAQSPDPTHPVPPLREKSFRVTFFSVIGAGVFVAIAGFTVWGARMGLSALIGAALAVSNLYVLSRIVASLTAPAAAGWAPDEVKRARTRRWGVVALFKIVFLFGAMYLLIRGEVVTPLGFVLGFGALPIGIAIGALLCDRSAAA